MAATWHYMKGAQTCGPISQQELLRLAASGEIGPADLVRKDGMESFIPAVHVKGLLPSVASAPRAGDESELVSDHILAPTGSDSRFLAWLVGVSVTLVLIGVVTFVGLRSSRQNKRDAAVSEAKTAVQGAMDAASRDAAAFAFDAAVLSLDRAQRNLSDSPVAIYLHEEQSRLDNALRRVRAQKREYDQKRADGYTVFEGRLTSPTERGNILADRQRAEDNRRRAQEARRQQEAQRLNAQRKEEQRAQEEAQRRQQEEVDIAAARADDERRQAMLKAIKGSPQASAALDAMRRLHVYLQSGVTVARYRELVAEGQLTIERFKSDEPDLAASGFGVAIQSASGRYMEALTILQHEDPGTHDLDGYLFEGDRLCSLIIKAYPEIEKPLAEDGALVGISSLRKVKWYDKSFCTRIIWEHAAADLEIAESFTRMTKSKVSAVLDQEQ